MGKRDYTAGDSLRRIDWKSTAAVGRLQTKLFEPSIALETVLFLNLNSEEYHYKFRYDASELAIVVAASLANWIIGQKQSVGLVVNGSDPHSAYPISPASAASKRPHSPDAHAGNSGTRAVVRRSAHPHPASSDPGKFQLGYHHSGIDRTGQDEALFQGIFPIAPCPG